MKKTNALRGTNPHFRIFHYGLIATLSACLLLLSLSSYGQVIRNYIQNNNVKNYAIEERPTTSGNEFVMAGTIFDNNIPANPRAAQGKGIHFMRVDAIGKTILYTGGIPNYIVSRRYNFPSYQDVRCVDIVPYTKDESIIIVQARLVTDPNNFLVNKDVILVVVVDNNTGLIISSNQLSNPNYNWSYDNIYATHAIYHKDNTNNNYYLYICGYDGIETQYPNYPEYTPQNGPSCFDKRILVLKYDINSPTPAVVANNTWDYPWPTCTTDQTYPYLYDFDMAMRLVPINDGSGDIYVTGSTNSDFAYETRPPFPVLIPSYGSATLSLRIEESNCNTVAIRPFIEHLWYNPNGHHETFEHGYGAFEDNTGNGLYVFSNQFSPLGQLGYGMSNFGPRIRMTYIDKATLNFNTFPDIHRFCWGPIDYDWGTQVLPSPNGSNKLYLAGLQYGWVANNCGSPAAPSLTPNWLNNVNPFLAELEPSWTVGTPNTIGLTSTNFWKTYFTMNGTGYYENLGGGLSNIAWATEFVATSAPLTGPVFTSPGWNPNVNAGAGGLNHKFTRTDANGDLPITGTSCDNSYMNCPPSNTYTIDIADAWFFHQHVEDVQNITVNSIQYEDPLFFISYDPYCTEPGFTPMYKSTGIASIENSNFSFSVYPNPVKDFINIKVDGSIINETVKVELISITGQQVAELYNGIASKLNTQQLPVNNVTSGVYMIKISSNSQSLHTEKIIIK